MYVGSEPQREVNGNKQKSLIPLFYGDEKNRASWVGVGILQEGSFGGKHWLQDDRKNLPLCIGIGIVALCEGEFSLMFIE